MVADFVDDVLKGFLKGSSGNKSGSSIGKMFNAVTLDSRCQDFINWSGRLQQEYPNLEILRIRHNEQTDYYARLFDDAHFEPFFGQRYDEMSEGTLADIGRNTLMECMKSSTYKRSLTWQSQLLRAFPPHQASNGSQDARFLLRYRAQGSRSAPGSVSVEFPQAGCRSNASQCGFL
jgi:hypothetical protein